MSKWGQTVITLNKTPSPTAGMHFSHMVPRKFVFLTHHNLSKIKIYWFTSLDIPKYTRRPGRFWVVERDAINEQLLFKDQIPVKTA